MSKLSIFLIGISFFMSLNTSLLSQGLAQFPLIELTQTNRLNPAIMTNNTWTIGLLSLSNSFHTNSLTLNEMIANERNTTLIIGTNIEKLQATNHIQEIFEVETFSLSYLSEQDWQWTFHHAIKGNIALTYPKILAQLIWEEEEQFLNQSHALTHDIAAFAYHEAGIGITKKLEGDLQIGGRFKILNGIGNLTLEQSDFKVNINENSSTLEANYQLQVASILESDELGRLNSSPSFQPTLRNLFSRNFGYAFDLGLQANLNQWSLGISLLDLGQIFWKNEARNYSFEGTYESTGLEIARAYFDSEIGFEVATDSLRQLFNVTETPEQYTSNLPSQFYGQITYSLNEKWQFLGTLHGQWLRDGFSSAFAIATRYQLLDAWNIGLNYSIQNRRFNNLGITTVVDLGALQLFALTTNIGSVFQLKQSQNSDFRLGLNILIANKN